MDHLIARRKSIFSWGHTLLYAGIALLLASIAMIAADPPKTRVAYYSIRCPEISASTVDPGWHTWTSHASDKMALPRQEGVARILLRNPFNESCDSLTSVVWVGGGIVAEDLDGPQRLSLEVYSVGSSGRTLIDAVNITLAPLGSFTVSRGEVVSYRQERQGSSGEEALISGEMGVIRVKLVGMGKGFEGEFYTEGSWRLPGDAREVVAEVHAGPGIRIRGVLAVGYECVHRFYVETPYQRISVGERVVHVEDRYFDPGSLSGSLAAALLGVSLVALSLAAPAPRGGPSPPPAS